MSPFYNYIDEFSDESLTYYLKKKAVKTHVAVSQRVQCEMVSLTLKYQFKRE